jgi:bis(5'-nucleosyl)-tetraphosphatase (symmetrical)
METRKKVISVFSPGPIPSAPRRRRFGRKAGRGLPERIRQAAQAAAAVHYAARSPGSISESPQLMATYAIGDIQGCFAGLEALLREIRFDRRGDRLLFAGDLVARGPESLETLRFVSGLGARALSVLGNHDLNLLALAARGERGTAEDRLGDIFDAPDGERLLAWLRRQRLAFHDRRHAVLMIHAGLAPQWTRQQALRLAAEAEQVIGDARAYARFSAEMYGDEPRRWSDELRGTARLRCIVNILTRARFCTAEGDFDFRYKGGIEGAPAPLLPWFAVPGRRSRRSTVVFGHWSTLGRVHWPEQRVYGLDTGYVWGGRLTALRLEDHRLFAVAAPRPPPNPLGRPLAPPVGVSTT